MTVSEQAMKHPVTVRPHKPIRHADPNSSVGFIMHATEPPTVESGWTSLRELIEHIVSTCHDRLRLAMPELEEVAERIAERGDVPADLRDQLQFELTALSDLLETHVSEQENWLFPTVRHLDDLVGATEWSGEFGDGIASLMDRVAEEHQQIQARLRRITECLVGWNADNLCSLKEDLDEQLQLVREQLPEHERLEIAELFPWIAKTLKENGLTNDGLFW